MANNYVFKNYFQKVIQETEGHPHSHLILLGSNYQGVL